ncbi:MAG: UPF0182 family protein [Acidimicrobiia bacterium]|nr:UPF0182 family protein [Acidimicrobiia bacterium]
MISRDPVPIKQEGGRRWLAILLAAVFVGVLTIRSIATFWTDYLWFSDLGQSGTWRTLILTRVWLVLAATAVAVLLFWINLAVADRLSPRTGSFSGSPDEELLERFQEWVGPRVRWVRMAVAGFFGLMVGLGASQWWRDWLLFRHGGTFGIEDPIYGNDVGVYVFDLPFYRDLFGWTFQLVLVIALVTAALHYLNGGIQVQRSVSAGVKVHLSVLFAALAVLKAFGYWLDRWELLYSDRGQVIGASFTDINAQRPALNLLIIVSLIAAVILLVNIRLKGWTLPIVAVGLWLLTSIGVGGIYPAIVQRFQVQPDELNKEIEFVAHNIEFTREAYGLTGIEVQDFAASSALTAADLEDNSDTVDNIRLWDPSVLFTTYQQLQAIVTFYDVSDVDVDRYRVDGELTQVMVSSRNLDEDSIPAPGWVNERLVYTHGFGAVLSPANNVTVEGQPDFLVKDIPPASSTPDIVIDEPRVYFSDDASSEYVIAGTSQLEVDFPIGGTAGELQYNNYAGDGGVELGGLLRRLAFAARFANFDTLISSRLSADSQVLLVRNIKDRITKLAPGFLFPDADPYLAVIDGQLEWVVDLYTISDQYPYSTGAPTGRLDAVTQGLPNSFNYIRNSVKATVSAFDGEVIFYVVDDSDPLVRAYQRIFPTLFTPGAEMPPELTEHLRYPEDMFRLQSDMYTLYHMTDASQFFSTVDPWEIARDPSTSERLVPFRSRELNLADANEQPMDPYYLLMKLPEDQDDADPSFIIMQPFTPRGRPNMVSFMVAKSGPGDYGQIIDFRLPSGTQLDGPRQMGELINQDPVISPEFSLLGQGGSRVIQGNMLLVPVRDSLLYVQPIYITAEREDESQAGQAFGAQADEGLTGIPEFKRVVVSYNGNIKMAETLDAALAAVFINTEQPVGPGGEPGELPSDVAELVTAARQALDEAAAALQAGDLGLYQAKVEEAADLLARAEQLSNEAVGAETDG